LSPPLELRCIGEREAADFAGTREGWWKRCYARHVAEHEEWLHADSGTNFPVRRKARGKVYDP
jgi:hypothetical protein